MLNTIIKNSIYCLLVTMFMSLPLFGQAHEQLPEDLAHDLAALFPGIDFSDLSFLDNQEFSLEDIFSGQLDNQLEKNQEDLQNISSHDISPAVQRIRESFKEYRLNAPWITKECEQLYLEDFELVWQEIVELLTTTKKRWFYFCDKPEDFDVHDYWKYCLWQCKTFHEWLQKVYIDPQTTELLIYDKQSPESAQAVSLFDYWLAQPAVPGKETAYHQFYAFYIDCVTQVYKEYIECAQDARADAEEFRGYFSLGLVSMDVIEKLLERIKNTRWYNKYHLDSKVLREVLTVLEDDYVSAV